MDLREVFERRAVVMKSVLLFCEVSAGGQEVSEQDSGARSSATLTWKHEGGNCTYSCPKCCCTDHRKVGWSHARGLSRGEWSLLVEESLIVAASGEVSRRRRRKRQQSDDIERRADRAWSLVQMGELSAGRQALKAAVVTRVTQRTLDMLQHSSRRPRAAAPGHIARRRTIRHDG